MKTVSVVLPTYNEKDNLEKFVNRVLSQQKKISQYILKIVIADSHSKDGTAEIAKTLARKNKKIHYINVDKGLGVGLYKGHLYALRKLKPNILMQLDADGQVDESIIPSLVHTIEDGYSLALGSRFVKNGKNELSFSRKIFSRGSSYVCRLIMGPLDIQEFTNSARAFTPSLFKKIDWNKIPWKKQTFIMQPAFLHEAIIAGAKYKEVPLVFKDRANGYSKNKIISYTLDILLYAIDVRLRQLGINIPLFQV